MKIQQLIRESILQQIGFIEEDIKGKIRIVQKLPNNITDDQKKQIIEILNDKPHLENPKGFDWTKAHKYTWDNFQIFFTESDPLKELKKLKHGKDYLTVKGIEAPGLLGKTLKGMKHLRNILKKMKIIPKKIGMKSQPRMSILTTMET